VVRASGFATSFGWCGVLGVAVFDERRSNLRVSVFGEHGAGKSTLLYIIAGAFAGAHCWVVSTMRGVGTLNTACSSGPQ
jgi:ABC-type sugar transport system ATPase subunit